MSSKRNALRAFAVATALGSLLAVAPAAFSMAHRVSADCFRLIGTSRLEWGGTSIGTSVGYPHVIQANLWDRSTHIRRITNRANSNIVAISSVNTGIVGGRRYSVAAVATGDGKFLGSNTCYVT
jgi:hypothetical protein